MDGELPSAGGWRADFDMTVLQVNRLNIVDQLLDWKADGIITDCTSASAIACVRCQSLTRGSFAHCRPERRATAREAPEHARCAQVPEGARALVSGRTPGEAAALAKA